MSMVYPESKVFSSGTEYDMFKYNYCQKCKYHKERESDGFPEFALYGGCPIEDEMESARFDDLRYPNKIIRKIYDTDNKKTVTYHYCPFFIEKEI